MWRVQSCSHCSQEATISISFILSVSHVSHVGKWLLPLKSKRFGCETRDHTQMNMYVATSTINEWYTKSFTFKTWQERQLGNYTLQAGNVKLCSQALAQLPIACSTVEGLVHFLTWVTSRTEEIMWMWASCKSQTTSPTRKYWSVTALSWKIAVHGDIFFVALHKTARRTLHASIVGRCCHAKLIHCPLKRHRVQELALTRRCHAKPIHGACKRYTVQVSLHSLFS